MFNIIRADFYRIMRSKIFYLTQLVMFILLLICVLSHTTFSAGISSDVLMQLVDKIEGNSWTGTQALLSVSMMAGSLIYFYLPLFVLSIGYDLTHGTIKNLISVGISRKVFYISKYITFIILTAIQYVFYYLFTFSIASLNLGIGTVEKDFLSTFVQSIGIQFLSLQAIFTITILVLYITKSNVASIIATVAFPVFFSMGSLLFPDSKISQYLNFQGNINSTFVLMNKGYWLSVSLVAFIFILLGHFLSYILFRQRDL